MFDIPNLHIDGDSPEGLALQSIITRDHVSPEEAVRKALRANPGFAKSRPQNNHAWELVGLLADDPDTAQAIRDAAMDRRTLYDTSAQ